MSPATWPWDESTCHATIGSALDIRESDLRALRFTPAFADLMRFQVERARALLREGRALVPRMPTQLAVDIDLFSRGGSAILDRIEARGFDVLSARPALTRWTKVRLLGHAVAAMGMAKPQRSQVNAIANVQSVDMCKWIGAKIVEHERHAMKMESGASGKLRVLRRLARRRGAEFLLCFSASTCPERRSMCALYAFLRHTDDLADEPARATDKARGTGRLAARARFGAGRTGHGVAWVSRSRRHSSPSCDSRAICS